MDLTRKPDLGTESENPLSDPIFTVSGPVDHYKAAIMAKMSAAKFVSAYQINKHNRAAIMLKASKILPSHRLLLSIIATMPNFRQYVLGPSQPSSSTISATQTETNSNLRGKSAIIKQGRSCRLSFS